MNSLKEVWEASNHDWPTLLGMALAVVLGGWKMSNWD